jgi:small subunit ribosomal protein S3
LILSELIKKDILKLNGVKLVINGRFNKSPRSRKKGIVLGSIPLQSISAEIDYFQSTVFTLVGTFGVKLWICRKIK